MDLYTDENEIIKKNPPRLHIGIDYGLARIGVAISETGQLARPFCVIRNKGDKKNLLQIADIIKKFSHTTLYSVVSSHTTPLVVLGLPAGTLAPECKRFGEILKNELGVDIDYENEHLSSVHAEEYIRKTNSKEFVDEVAAAVILNSYLERRK